METKIGDRATLTLLWKTRDPRPGPRDLAEGKEGFSKSMEGESSAYTTSAADQSNVRNIEKELEDHNSKVSREDVG